MISFGTKAETIERLSRVVTTAKVLPQIRFTVREWQEAAQNVIDQIHHIGWLHRPLIVRSSTFAEDGSGHSKAGHYLSVPDVQGDEQLRIAISKVIGSYDDHNGAEQVFIQPMLSDVVLSGVAFSVDPNTGGPYIVVNYDDTTGSTSSVTSGYSADTKTFYYFKPHESDVHGDMGRIRDLIKELESILETDKIDIEFAITDDGHMYLLQVRPLFVEVTSSITDTSTKKCLKDIERKIFESNKKHPYLHGSKTIFGIMPDWNPAEIIGVRPRPLALSLYKELITDNIWAYQRDNYGYKNLRSFPLLISFHGLPYIDVRVDFNSFIPSDIQPELAEKLVNYYIDSLVEHPNNHDKVEFEIVFTCYTFDIQERLAILRNFDFSEQDCEKLTESLRTLTNRIIHGEIGLWQKDIERISQLESRLKIIAESSLDRISKIYWFIEDCKRYGTLPFAGLARAGFIAVQLLKSLVNIGILNREEYENFMGSLDTVGSRMTRDFERLKRNAFLNLYGHLRPGTYDILSPRYDEEPERYFDWNNEKGGFEHKRSNFVLSLDQLKKIQNLLLEQRLEYDVLGLFDFIRYAIEGREHSKFIFTRTLSEVLSLLKELAIDSGLTIDDMSYADITFIEKVYTSSADVVPILKQSIEEGKKNYVLTKQIILPPLIIKPEDIWAFHMFSSEPNFITQKTAMGHVAFATEGLDKIKNSILLIPSADPGYDWIFSHGIAGFITMYGGINSHMAIRAGELGIAAIIGAGEGLYAKWEKAKMLEIDCNNKQVRVLK